MVPVVQPNTQRSPSQKKVNHHLRWTSQQRDEEAFAEMPNKMILRKEWRNKPPDPNLSNGTLGIYTHFKEKRNQRN